MRGGHLYHMLLQNAKRQTSLGPFEKRLASNFLEGRQLVLDLLELRGGPEFAVQIIFQHLTDLFGSCVQHLSLSRLIQVTRRGFGVGR